MILCKLCALGQTLCFVLCANFVHVNAKLLILIEKPYFTFVTTYYVFYIHDIMHAKLN